MLVGHILPVMDSKGVLLQPGHFYVSRDDETWCCFRLIPRKADHCQADCVRLSDCRVESFYADGRYDVEGKREHTLIGEQARVEVSEGIRVIAHRLVAALIAELLDESVSLGEMSRIIRSVRETLGEVDRGSLNVLIDTSSAALADYLLTGKGGPYADS